MKIALVCDWLTNVGGAEKVLLELHQMYPKAPIYTSKYSKKGIDWFNDADVRTGWLQMFPAKLRRILGPLRQRWFSKLDLSEYDLIISVTGAEAKSVKSGKWLHANGEKAVNPKGIHISFCHVPTQYYWQMYDTYVENPGFGVLNPVVRFFFKLLVKPLRKADYKVAQRPDYYVTISEYAKVQIKKYYGREATVIHPPVETEVFKQGNNKFEKSQVGVDGEGNNIFQKSQEGGSAQVVENFDITKTYITTSRQVNWKRLDIAIRGCMKADRHLLVIGEGPLHDDLVKLAGDSDYVKFLPLMSKDELSFYLGQARGFIFPSLEPFGIAPVEALSAGCPVIAYGEGGALDYVVDGKNGVLFKKQTASSLADAISRFEKMKFNRKKVAESVDKFAMERFDQEIKAFVNEKVE
jgi:glycosyltransferase involved in cell wall biosynthesis